MRNNFHLTSRLSSISRLSKGGAVLSAFLILAALFFFAAFTSCEATAAASNEKILSAISIKNPPSKTTFAVGEELDLFGLEVQAIYSDGSTKLLDSKDYTSLPAWGTVLTDTGTVVVTITYQKKTVNFNITVSEKAEEKKYTGIKVKTLPSKVKYTQGELFSTDGLKVNGIKEDGTMEEIPSGWTNGAHWFTSPENGSKLKSAGKVTVTVEYTNNPRSVAVIRGTSFDKIASRGSDIFNYYDTFEITVEKAPEVLSDSFFWGIWVRMDNGVQYEILENKVNTGGKSYKITASGVNSEGEKEITCETLGTFTKQSDSVILNGAIPYFRNGGTNLDYSLKLVGFSNGSRAVSQIAKSGLKGLGKSKNFPSYESNGESDSNGLLKLKAPTANDSQTVSLTLDDGSLMVIPDIMVANSGDYMGTVAIVEPDQYNLKITGKIADYQKDDGYLYGNNTKTYDMTLTIKNISENDCKSSVCIIEPDDNRLSISSSENISALDISTMPAGTSRTVNLTVSFGDMTEPYVDTGVKVTLINAKTNQEWSDYVPLRFYKGLIPITVSARNTEKNDQAALNGFIIYPDGNNQFFSVKDNSTSILFVPTFGGDKKYKMVFSGATVTSNLSSSTEMYYSVAPGSSVEKEIDLSVSDYRVKLGWKNYGGENHSEDDAFAAEEAFIAYLDAGDIDYYTLNADSTEFYAPGGAKSWRVSYSSKYGEIPSSFLCSDGSTVSEAELPSLSYEGYVFKGWKALGSGDSGFVKAGEYEITGNTTLVAVWKKLVIVKYESQKATASVPEALTLEEDTALTAAQLPTLKEDGFKHTGWYTESTFSEGTKVTAGYTLTDTTPLTLYAKWEKYAGPVKLPSGTDGTAGTSATYVLFGDWPQTVKAADVMIDETQSEEHGLFTYYLGSDGCWYVKCTENACGSGYTYSDGTTAAQSSAGSTKYFKVEPIKWRVLTENYNSTGKALLLAENILTGNVPYYISSSTRTISSSTVYANNYKYSSIRAYLNGIYESDDIQTKTYQNKGFLQTAFTADAQNLIATANVDNTAASTTDAGGNISQATSYACANTSDKIFLLSFKEVTTTSYGFTADYMNGEGNSRIRVASDFAEANHAIRNLSSGVGAWWLRSPRFNGDAYAYSILTSGDVINKYSKGVWSTTEGVVPALSISLE